MQIHSVINSSYMLEDRLSKLLDALFAYFVANEVNYHIRIKITFAGFSRFTQL